MSNKAQTSTSAVSIAHFDAMAGQWWDLNGPLKTLHEINPYRMQYIREHTTLHQQDVLDVGCGGGILSEAMARFGAKVTGIDLAENNIAAAKAHADQNDLSISYQCTSADKHLQHGTGHYKVVTCMELLEHVPNPDEIVAQCVALCAPGGDLFFSTINRTPKAFATAIIGAEYICGLIPKGTHHYRDLIKPSELAAWLYNAGATLRHVQGFHYAAFTGKHRLCDDAQVNYMIHARKEKSP